jgi:16S rRNA C967 or C1407 C5-methylase (RsmB/RsmF family)/NOL1/NOP2/fmu family ribosome biogenesis protein
MKNILGEEYYEFEKSLTTVSPTSVRLNEGVKLPRGGLDLPLTYDVPWCRAGKYLAQRPVFTLDPLFQAGSYYVQEAASMFVEQCINTVKKLYGHIDCLLDLCAAPGGKSTHLAMLCPDSLLVSNEVIRSRVAILAENIAKCGAPNTVITSADSSSFTRLPHFFDFILVDAPCSGEGLFRKDHKALNEWSSEHVKHCAGRQSRILRDVWNALKPGGFLLYSTCTYNKEENENTVRYIIESLGATTVPVDFPALVETGISPSLAGDVAASRFYPHKTGSEGFFVALVRKNGDAEHRRPKKSGKNIFKGVELDSWIKNRNNYTLFTHRSGTVSLIPEKHDGELEYLAKKIPVLLAGTEICALKGKEIIPAFDFAHSKIINIDNFAIWEIDRATALDFFRKNTIIAPQNLPVGYLLLLHRGVPLGWVKNIGSRCNNLLPPHRRIRMNGG